MSSITFYQILYKGQCLYIGSTRNIRLRYAEHKSAFNLQKYTLSKTLVKYSQNFEDFDFQEICIENHTLESRLWREREVIEKYKPSCNKNRPVVSQEEKHEKKLENYKKASLRKNICNICGGKYTAPHKSEHLQTEKHQTALNQE